MSDQIQSYLDRSELFARLEPDTAQRIISRFKTVNFPANTRIVREMEEGDTMYIITRGEVAVEKNMGWGYLEIKRLGAGDFFGEIALLSRERRSADVRAVTEVECMSLDLESFNAVADEDPRFCRQVLRVVSRRFSDVSQRSTNELLTAYRSVMFALAGLAESRDPDTGAHLSRTRNYCGLLAKLLSRHPSFENQIYPGFVESIYNVAPLHDIGKVAIPDCVLLKPGRLTDDEYTLMKTHAVHGAECLKKVMDSNDVELFRMAYRLCRHHHERWDGNGYPDKLAGANIPIEARIMSLADVYDALLMKRVYKAPMSYEATRDEIQKCSGTAFDPEMARVMVENMGEFEKIHQKFEDED